MSKYEDREDRQDRFVPGRYQVKNHGNGFFSISEDLKGYGRKATPYQIKFMFKDDKLTVIRGNLLLNNAEIRAIFKRGF